MSLYWISLVARMKLKSLGFEAQVQLAMLMPLTVLLEYPQKESPVQKLAETGSAISSADFDLG
jgi:hypothetical protein